MTYNRARVQSTADQNASSAVSTSRKTAVMKLNPWQ